MINSRKETAVDIILKVSENSHGNVRSEVLIKVVAYEHGFCQLFRIKIFPRYPEHRRAFLKVFYKSSCLSLITVMKYLNFHSNGWRALHGSLLKIALRHRCFWKNFIISAEHLYWKLHLDGCFWGQLYFGNFPQWLLLKDSCKDIQILS